MTSIDLKALKKALPYLSPSLYLSLSLYAVMVCPIGAPRVQDTDTLSHGFHDQELGRGFP